MHAIFSFSMHRGATFITIQGLHRAHHHLVITEGRALSCQEKHNVVAPMDSGVYYAPHVSNKVLSYWIVLQSILMQELDWTQCFKQVASWLKASPDFVSSWRARSTLDTHFVYLDDGGHDVQLIPPQIGMPRNDIPAGIFDVESTSQKRWKP